MKINWIRLLFPELMVFDDGRGFSTATFGNKGVVRKSPRYFGRRSARVSGDTLELLLNDIVGLDGVKQMIREIYATVLMNQRRQSKGFLKGSRTTLHMSFLGNPGTGKTTVARLIGRIFCEMGVLSKGSFIEVDQSKLVSPYVGATPQKVMDMVQEAMGGVLFIDEAYALSNHGSDSNGGDSAREVVDTLVKAMEDYRDDLCIIFAGYTEPMQEFMKMNPGMQSRIPFILYFDDYTSDQLIQILKYEAQKLGFIILPDAIEFTREYLELCDAGQLGNGRYVRNILETSIRKQSLRLMMHSDRTNSSEIMVLTADDFREAVKA